MDTFFPFHFCNRHYIGHAESMFVTYLPMTNHSLIFQVTSRGWIVDETESPIFVHGLSNSGARDKKGHTDWG